MPGLIPSAARLFLSRPRRALLLLRMAGWVAILSFVVTVFSLPRALRIVSISHARKSAANDDEQQDFVSAIDAILGLNLLCFKPICWKRAALLHRYLALNGITTRILFGVRRETDGRIGGHAWLEASGSPILETTAPNYVVTYAFPSNEPFEVDLNLLTER